MGSSGAQVVLPISGSRTRQLRSPLEFSRTESAGAGNANPAIAPRPEGDPDGLPHRNGKHRKTVIINVLADQVHPARSEDDMTGSLILLEGLSCHCSPSHHHIHLQVYLRGAHRELFADCIEPGHRSYFAALKYVTFGDFERVFHVHTQSHHSRSEERRAG